MTRTTIEPRKRPKQARSQEMLERILRAAVNIIAERGVEGLTTNHIAEEAGVSVASVYQFFPNKQAVIFATYKDWLTEIGERVAALSEQLAGKVPWQRLALELAQCIGAQRFSHHTEFELLRAMWSHRELIELDRTHVRRLAETTADLMLLYGSALPRRQLVVLAEFANGIFTLAVEQNVAGTAADWALVSRLSCDSYLHLWAVAVEGAWAPGPPSTSSTSRGNVRQAAEPQTAKRAKRRSNPGA